ncbi:hypothetical protein Clacol_001418 [Clathrus columnatus]|uniref:MutL C-terminal dimerisation domain-containing protein n=1 Tax=Clathrus columnatus TaxID=1419009 RepID=A0AAV5A164_9AGAM|nr:hypothetical protein Clacol_001418 [Clathrus columnatus]
MASIITLPEFSRTILRSSTILTSIPQIIHEIVQNSLDAGASQVDIGVNLGLWQCWIRDNGHGIDRTDMKILAKGGEEGRYGSSKAHDVSSLNFVSTFGFRGEALASTADISILEIFSRTNLALDTWSVTLKGGKSLYYGPAARWKHDRAGTTVVVRDAFYNLPIRRRTHPNTSRTLELIRKDLECMALVFPQVAFSLENSSKEQIEGSRKGRILTIPKTSSSLATFRHLFGKALCENVEEINFQEGEVCVRGFLSLEGTQTKSHQYLYLNRQLLSPCELHRIIDAKFASSLFGRYAVDGNADAPTKLVRRSPRKNERRPVYLLSIILPPRSVDNCVEPAKASVNVKGPPTPCKRRRTTKTAEPAVKLTKNPESEGINRTPVVDPFCTKSAGEAPWVDAITGRIYSVDLKTGHSYDINTRSPSLTNDDDEYSRTRVYVDTSRLRKTGDVERIPQWIQSTLATWKNPIFGFDKGKDDIPSLLAAASQGYKQVNSGFGINDKETISRNFDKTQLENAEIIGQVDRKFIACLIKDTSTRQDQPRQALALVDQHAADERVRVEQFLSELCTGFLNHDSNNGVETSRLNPPVPILLNKFEAHIFRGRNDFQQAFRRWGFELESTVESELGLDEEVNCTSEYAQVLVKKIPGILSEKLLTGDELEEFVKGYLARLAVEGTDFGLSQMNNNDHWTGALRWCPRELIDLVNSKACRGV